MTPTQKRIAPVFPVELGGRSLSLQFNFNAYAAFEEVTGKNFFEVISKLGELMAADAAASKLVDPSGKLFKPDQTFRIVDATLLRALIYAGVQGAAALAEESKKPDDEDLRMVEDGKLTVRQIGNLMGTGTNLLTLLPAILNAQSAAQPDPEPGSEGSDRPPRKPVESSIG